MAKLVPAGYTPCARTSCDVRIDRLGETMKVRYGLIALAAMCAATTAVAQQKAAQKSAYKAPRTEFGHPNLQGNWNNATLTGMERAAKFGTRNVMTPEEAAEIEGGAAKH